MSEFLLKNEAVVRLLIFLFVFGLMATWELIRPCRNTCRNKEISRGLRWSNHIGLAVINAALVRVCYPMAAITLAAMAEQNGWGFFNQVSFSNIELQPWIALIISLVLLDLGIYTQHLVFHHVPILWRIHRVHHADLEFDVSTGFRFHPAEMLISMAIKLGMILVLGPSALAVFIFEIVLSTTAMFNHANIKIPAKLDRVLRLILVTPDMHRVHHSINPLETASNFGFNLPWWDRLFGTYLPQPKLEHENMLIGTPQFRERRDLYLDRLLLQPLR